jgi:hypothetical protein
VRRIWYWILDHAVFGIGVALRDRAMAMTVWLSQVEAVLAQLGAAERPAGGVS